MVTLVTWCCYRLQPGSYNLSLGRIFGGHAIFGEFSGLRLYGVLRSCMAFRGSARARRIRDPVRAHDKRFAPDLTYFLWPWRCWAFS
jgi:hypothetical protein